MKTFFLGMSARKTAEESLIKRMASVKLVGAVFRSIAQEFGISGSLNSRKLYDMLIIGAFPVQQRCGNGLQPSSDPMAFGI